MSILVTLSIFWACTGRKHNVKNDFPEDKTSVDLGYIKASGKITALVDNSSTSYFIYKGEPMGFEYEMLSRFAAHLGIRLEIKVVRNMDSIIDFLNRGEGDLIAANYTVTSERQKIVSFSEPLLVARQVLVQRKPDGWQNMSAGEVDNLMVRKQIDLAGKEVYVRKNSSFYARLKSLSDEIGSPIKIVEAPGEYETELLIKLVAEGEIAFTVADENVAMVSGTYYPNIDFNTAISFPQKISWAVRKQSHALLGAINRWMEKEKSKNDFIAVYDKYFKNPKAISERKESPYFSYSGGRISQYDHIAKIYSKQLHWDWRLLVALMYQESHFDQAAKSWAGAFGVMQLMPGTAAMYGVDSLSTASQHVAAGTRYLAWLENFWEQFISDSVERLKFVLASYNVGVGHIIDARNLAIKYNMEPDIWEGNVAECVLLKSNPKYYNDTVVKYGYCRGEEPFNYVREILLRYEMYRQVIVAI